MALVIFLFLSHNTWFYNLTEEEIILDYGYNSQTVASEVEKVISKGQKMVIYHGSQEAER